MKQMLIFLAVVIQLFLSSAHAKVVSSDKHGFTIKITDRVSTSPEKAYQQFLNIDQWWHGDHTWFGDAQALSIDARVGGCFCEIKGDKQALHMTVSYVEPNKEIRMIGGLGPLQMLGVHGGMSWSFKPVNVNETEITLHYQVTGFTPEGLDKLAPIVDKVQQLQFDRLIDKLKS